MWDNNRYLQAVDKCQRDLDTKKRRPYEYMLKYKNMIKAEDYETAKAITEVLKPLNYNTADTHNHIYELQAKK